MFIAISHQLFSCLLVEFLEFFVQFYNNPLSDIFFCNFFQPVSGLSFHSCIINVFFRAENFIFNKIQLVNSSFNSMPLVFYIK